MNRTLKFVVALAVAALCVGFAPRAMSAVLLYDHNTNLHNGKAALDQLGLAYTTANSGDFNTLLTGSAWDLVVMDCPSTIPAGGWASFISYTDGGGKSVVSYWTLESQAALATAFDVVAVTTFGTPRDVYRWSAAHDVFNVPNVVGDLTSWTDTWNDDGDELAILGGSGAQALAGFSVAPDANRAAIVLGNSGRTIYNGFLFDEILDSDGVNLIANEIRYVHEGAEVVVPEPTTLALLGIGALAAFGRKTLRRRKPA